jgi:hypothetical protein
LITQFCDGGRDGSGVVISLALSGAISTVHVPQHRPLSLDDAPLSIPPSLSSATVLGVKTDALIMVAIDDNINCTLFPSLSTKSLSSLLPPSPSPYLSNIVNTFTVVTSSAAEEEESKEQQKLWQTLSTQPSLSAKWWWELPLLISILQ